MLLDHYITSCWCLFQWSWRGCVCSHWCPIGSLTLPGLYTRNKMFVICNTIRWHNKITYVKHKMILKPENKLKHRKVDKKSSLCYRHAQIKRNRHRNIDKNRQSAREKHNTSTNTETLIKSITVLQKYINQAQIQK